MGVPEKCFTITIDGKKYGPYLDMYRSRFSKVEHLKGVLVHDVWIESGWV